MLRKSPKLKSRVKGGRFAIVASQYNARFVDSMLRAAQAELKHARAKEIKIIRVPGAYEIPVVAARIAASRKFSAVICLGVILRGETTHAAHIGEAVSQALMEIQLATGVPVIHEVLLLENEQQAKARCLSPEHNRGREAAQTAWEMARVMGGLERQGL